MAEEKDGDLGQRADSRQGFLIPQRFLSTRNLCFALCLAYYLGQPPVQTPWFAWISCLLFAVLVHSTPNVGKRQWLSAWTCSSLMWLALLQGIRLAFWPLTFGWIALSLYLAIYFPIALAIGSSLHHRSKFRLPWACAIAWTTTELLRSYIITGFAACALVHSQTPWPAVMQVASVFGGYGVGFLMMLTCGWVAESIIVSRKRKDENTEVESRNWLQLVLHGLPRTCVMLWVLLTAANWISRQRLLDELAPIKPLGQFVLIQANMPTMFESTEELMEEGARAYHEVTKQAFEETRGKPIDVMVWPESVFAMGAPTMFWDQGPIAPPELMLQRSQLAISYNNLQLAHASKMQRFKRDSQGTVPNLLVGTDVFEIIDGKLNRYNAALWIPKDDDPSDAPNSKLDFYAKQHLVMFGEYIPVLSWFPSVMQQIGLGTLSSGRTTKSWKLPSGRRITTNVCFEDVVPHLMQRQLKELKDRREAPDVMINISNDGWFRGSSILNHHLNSAIVTAVENRIPVLVASNTGISAWIDGDGRVVKQLPKLEGGSILAEPIPDGREGLWSYWGDWPARCVTLVGLIPACRFLLSRRRRAP
jgi:apolipoprotein N-acyltransferase